MSDPTTPDNLADVDPSLVERIARVLGFASHPADAPRPGDTVETAPADAVAEARREVEAAEAAVEAAERPATAPAADPFAAFQAARRARILAARRTGNPAALDEATK